MADSASLIFGQANQKTVHKFVVLHKDPELLVTIRSKISIQKIE
jgi:hypothetical protein